MPVITNAGEYLITQQQQKGEALIIDKMILANIAGLDSDTLPSRDQSMPAPADVKIIKPITKDGLLNTNTVVYSTVFPSTDGTFDFNYMGLYSSAHDVIVAVAYVPLQTKIKTVGTDVGNVITKNFAIEFNAAADITGINISAESWQIDYTARLMSMDKHQRDLVKNIYGPSTFLNDAFKVKFETDTYYLTAGKAILGGINFELEADLEILPGALPQTVWLDVYQETSMMGVLNKHDVVINDGTVLTDYVAGSVEHTLVKLGVVNSSVDIVDLRSLVRKSLELRTKKDEVASIAELRNTKAEYPGQKIHVASYYDGWGANILGPLGGGDFYYESEDDSSVDDGGSIIINVFGERFIREDKGFASPVDYGARTGGSIIDTVSVTSAIARGGIIDLEGFEYLIDGGFSITSAKTTIKNGKLISVARNRINIDASVVKIKDLGFKNVEVIVGDFLANTRLTNFKALNCRFDIDTGNTLALDVKCIKGAEIKDIEVYSTAEIKASGIRFHNDKNLDTKLNSEKANIKDCIVDGCSIGIHCYGTGNRLNFSFVDNHVTNCISKGIDAYHCFGNKCTGNRISDCGNGIWYDSGDLSESYPSILAFNQITRCAGVGIITEEIINGLICNNVILDCLNEGILITAGVESTIINNNNIMKCSVGIAVMPSNAPVLLQGYFNINNTISNNKIQNCRSYGIYVEKHERDLYVDFNHINSNNLDNAELGFGILISDAQNVSLEGNRLGNSFVSRVIEGYQDGIAIGYTKEGSFIDIGDVSIVGNRVNSARTHNLYIGYSGIGNGDNTAGIFSNNFFKDSTKISIIKNPDTFSYSNNVGIQDGSISNSTTNSIRFNKGVSDFSELPAASISNAGTLAKVRSISGSTVDQYYICKRVLAGAYDWVEVFV